jgi:sugar/nucleoside kinase (ribokinase family)
VDFDVIGLGYCCLDDLLLLTEIPPPEGRATILRRERQGGGMVATAMVAVARLGGRAGFAGKVGDDAIGREIVADFRRYGVDVSRLVVQAGATSHLTLVLVDRATGARAFLSQRGTVPDLAPGELDRDYLTRGRILHLSDAAPAAVQAAAWARAAGREVCFDGTHFHPSVFGLFPYLDYLIVSRFFASEFVAHQEGRDLGRAARDFAALSAPRPAPPAPHRHPYGAPRTPDAIHGTPAAPGPGGSRDDAPVHHPAGEVAVLAGERLLDAAARLRQLGPPVVVVTEGERGSWCATPDGQFHVPAYPVRPLDTTGAGDVFHGAFLYGRARGWDLRRSLALASAAASLKCRALGGRAGIPTLEEALSLVESNERPAQ